MHTTQKAASPGDKVRYLSGSKSTKGNQGKIISDAKAGKIYQKRNIVPQYEHIPYLWAVLNKRLLNMFLRWMSLIFI